LHDFFTLSSQKYFNCLEIENKLYYVDLIETFMYILPAKLDLTVCSLPSSFPREICGLVSRSRPSGDPNSYGSRMGPEAVEQMTESFLSFSNSHSFHD